MIIIPAKIMIIILTPTEVLSRVRAVTDSRFEFSGGTNKYKNL